MVGVVKVVTGVVLAAGGDVKGVGVAGESESERVAAGDGAVVEAAATEDVAVEVAAVMAMVVGVEEAVAVTAVVLTVKWLTPFVFFFSFFSQTSFLATTSVFWPPL